MTLTTRVAAALCLCLVAWRPAAAASIEDVEFADRVSAGGEPLVLSGLGLLRYRVIFRGYVAALYLPEGTDPAQALRDVPKRLEIEYFWSIGGQAIREAGEEILARNVPPERLEALGPRLARIGALYRDVEPGDRYALTYVPGRGTELAKNGEPLGVIEGSDFAAAYFSIWLGQAPIDEPLREQLLSRTQPIR
jgi:hypothetical protein